jgi:2-amino-4-hydroxy-6-hydroxymethyldihydropteridine diphosphokinase
MSEAMHLYAIAIGSNRRHVRHGRPSEVVQAALAELDSQFDLFDASPVIGNAAIGGAGRDFANGLALIESRLAPMAMLDSLKRLERSFGRRTGKRWGARVLDLDIVAWSGGKFASRTLQIPHPRLTERSFVLGPLASVAPHWRINGYLTATHLLTRLGKRHLYG